jgi:hypothetical protein
MSQTEINGCEKKPGTDAAVSFGKKMRKNHFLFDDGYINLNQGMD